jgi:hypothetical protein
MSTCAVLAVLLGAAAGDRPVQTDWFPLAVGNAWHYRAADGRFTIRVAAHEKVGEMPCARLETVRNGRVIASEHIRVAHDGVYRMDIDLKRDDQVYRQTPDPAILLLPLPPRNGQTFSVKSRVDGKWYEGKFKLTTEEVKVPAGTYKAIAVTSTDLEAEGIQPHLTTWYAEKVGMVKKVISAGGQKVVIELEKFEPTK